jgi:hypothetical protein
LVDKPSIILRTLRGPFLSLLFFEKQCTEVWIQRRR